MTATTREELHRWMEQGEAKARVEFKEAKTGLDPDKTAKYCVALANERGGKLILGVDDASPRRIVGSSAFGDLEARVTGLRQQLRIPVVGEAPIIDGKRVVILHIPSRPVGVAIDYKGQYWARDGESLISLSSDQLREIFAEAGGDFSADMCDGLMIDDLDPVAIDRFREYVIRKTENTSLRSLSHESLLRDMELLGDGGLRYAALILFGTRNSVRQHLGAAELIYEYRSSDASGPAQERIDYQRGVFGYIEDVWEKIESRNDQVTYQVGTQVLPIATFDRRSVREGILNAIAHRNYQLAGSIFVRQFPRRIEITSPGGLPTEVTTDNILNRSSPRNRRIAELLQKCAVVERSGQGVNLMYEAAIRDTKALPNFGGSDQYQVCLVLSGKVTDEAFVRFIRTFDDEKLRGLGTECWLALERIRSEKRLVDGLRQCTDELLQMGLVVRGGRGQFLLNEAYYRFRGQESRFRELRQHEEKKERLEAEIAPHRLDGISRGDLNNQIDDMSYEVIGKLLNELAEEGRVHSQGAKRGVRWHPGPSDDS